MREIKKIIVHHTASPRDTTTVEAVDRYHRDKNWGSSQDPAYAKKSSTGWYVQYHYFIEASGKITQTAAHDDIRWHTIGQNEHSLAICMAGWFDPDHDAKPTDAQIVSLTMLLRMLVADYGITSYHVYPHRAFQQKTCYGMNLSDDWARSLVEKPQILNQNLTLVLGNDEFFEKFRKYAEIASNWIHKASNGQIIFHNALKRLADDHMPPPLVDADLQDAWGQDLTGAKIVLPKWIADKANEYLEGSGLVRPSSVALVYDSRLVAPEKTVHAAPRVWITGFTIFELAFPGINGEDPTVGFYLHEMLHSWYQIINQRKANGMLKDDVHDHGSYNDARPEKNYAHIITDSMKGYTDALHDGGSVAPVPEPPANQPVKETMITIKQKDQPEIYVQSGGVLIHVATTWEEYKQAFPDANIVELDSAEFAKFRVVETLALKKK